MIGTSCKGSFVPFNHFSFPNTIERVTLPFHIFSSFSYPGLNPVDFLNSCQSMEKYLCVKNEEDHCLACHERSKSIKIVG